MNYSSGVKRGAKRRELQKSEKKTEKSMKGESAL